MKKFKNRLTFGEVTDESILSCFLTHSAEDIGMTVLYDESAYLKLLQPSRDQRARTVQRGRNNGKRLLLVNGARQRRDCWVAADQ